MSQSIESSTSSTSGSTMLIELNWHISSILRVTSFSKEIGRRGMQNA